MFLAVYFLALLNIVICTYDVKIYGGKEATPGSWPWQALLRIGHNTGDNIVLCGGSIISDEWILTAAHCVEKNLDPAAYQVVLGEHNVNVVEGTEVISGVSQIIPHPRYLKKVKNEWDNDVALLKLSKRLNFTGDDKHLSAINLAWPDTQIVDQKCVATGWGRTQTGKNAVTLQQVQLFTYNRTKCSQEYSDATITEGMICAGHPHGHDACKGDSGGPLQCPISKDIYSSGWVQIGITSWGPECGTQNTKPGVYTRVASYNKWIRETAFTSNRKNRRSKYIKTC